MATIDQQVIDYFKQNEDNRVKVIAAHFNITNSIVSRIIDNHFKMETHD